MKDAVLGFLVLLHSFAQFLGRIRACNRQSACIQVLFQPFFGVPVGQPQSVGESGGHHHTHRNRLAVTYSVTGALLDCVGESMSQVQFPAFTAFELVAADYARLNPGGFVDEVQ